MSELASESVVEPTRSAGRAERGRALSEWDYVVVGAGSAGAVVASRHAAGGRHRVLLLEAGEERSTEEGAGHPLRDAGRLVLQGYNWDYQASLRAGGKPRFPYRLGRVVGGSSAVNGAVALRGLPRDFDEWVKLGNPDWSWERVLPYYRRLEDDRDISDDQHGQGGPVPITRPEPDQLHPLDVAFWRECTRRGLPDLPDLNGGAEAGVGPVPANAVGGARIDTATAYLPLAPSLQLWTRTHATRIVLAGSRAVGVEVLQDGRPTTVRARHVILSAGAVGTPAILLCSGIGSAERCAALGITPVADLPGVGENLADHASVVIWAVPKPGARRPGNRWRQVAARLPGGFDGEVDLMAGLLANVDTGTIPGFAGRLDGTTAVGISVMLLRPESRGRVYLDHADPHRPPVIELALGSAGTDVARLACGVRLAWSLLRAPGIAGELESIQFWSDRMIGDDRVLESGVRHLMNPGWHATGTARMGPASDRMSVVDQRCRVHGIENLQVVDASVFPAIPSAPTNLTTIMLAERIASRTEG